MTRFEGGPANGQTLTLRRIPAPLYLRVTEEAGKFDALDMLDDEPRAGETLYVYKRHGEHAWCHLNIAGGRGGMFQIATYRYLEEQPDQRTLRSRAAWQEWAACQPRA